MNTTPPPVVVMYLHVSTTTPLSRNYCPACSFRINTMNCYFHSWCYARHTLINSGKTSH